LGAASLVVVGGALMPPAELAAAEVKVAGTFCASDGRASTFDSSLFESLFGVNLEPVPVLVLGASVFAALFSVFAALLAAGLLTGKSSSAGPRRD
jgi:hypothetical protein